MHEHPCSCPCLPPARGAAGSRTDPIELDSSAHGHAHWAAEVLAALALAGTPAAAAGAPAEAGGGEAASASGAGSKARPPLHMGVSLGGALLLDLMATRPETVGGAVLVVPGSLNPGRWRAGLGGGQAGRLLTCCGKLEQLLQRPPCASEHVAGPGPASRPVVQQLPTTGCRCTSPWPCCCTGQCATTGAAPWWRAS